MGRISLGIPSFLGLDVSNDLWGDGGDRFRTSHVRLNFGPLRMGQALFTGDPGLEKEDRRTEDINGKRTYVRNPYGNDPDKYRHGTFYLGSAEKILGVSKCLRQLADASRQNEVVLKYCELKTAKQMACIKLTNFYIFLFISLQGFSIILLKTLAFICLKFTLFLLLSL